MSASASTSSFGSSVSHAATRTLHIPPTLRHFEGTFKNARGLSLFYFALFPLPNVALRGVVLFLHGTGDHCRRFLFLYERLCEEGFGVVTYDLVNHGASDCDSHQTRAHVRNFRCLVDDTNAFITFAKNAIYTQAQSQRQPHWTSEPKTWDPPLIITGISFGTLLGMHTVLSGQHKFHAAFWSGPLVAVSWTPTLTMQAAVIHPLSLLLPRWRIVAAVDYELLCRDPGFMADFETDPLAARSDLTARSGQQILSAMIRLKRNKSVEEADSVFCQVPMLFIAGSEDKIADQDAMKHFFARLANRDKELQIFDGVFHCVYEDPERDDVLAHLTHWLRTRCPKGENS
ncbi:hypothetical protein BBJ28_00003707 [Nothophytophthora sp. Chile5]|nr:hypothetical protein BBJ28_00003707 [Nothophytophthora sp. Chile5]